MLSIEKRSKWKKIYSFPLVYLRKCFQFWNSFCWKYPRCEQSLTRCSQFVNHLKFLNNLIFYAFMWNGQRNGTVSLINAHVINSLESWSWFSVWITDASRSRKLDEQKIPRLLFTHKQTKKLEVQHFMKNRQMQSTSKEYIPHVS